MAVPSPAGAEAAELDRIAALLAAGDAAQAADRARRLHERFPQQVEAARLFGIALLNLGRPQDARALFESARRLAPASIEVLCNLGSAALACEDVPAALQALESAHALAPSHPAVLSGLGTARRAAGDLAGAVAAYAESTRAKPGYVAGWLNLAAAELALSRLDDAERDARRALGLARDHPEGWLLLGHVLTARQRFRDAEKAYAQGAELAPGDVRFPYQIGLMAEEQGRLGAAVAAYDRALALDSGFDQALGQQVFLKRRLCDWDGLDVLSARLRERAAASSASIAPFGFLAEPVTAAEQLRMARSAAAHVEARMAAQRAASAHAPRPAHAPLRTGFVSNGFGEHPTGLLTAALFEALGATPLEVHLFATAPDDGGPTAARLRRAARWHAAADLPPAALAGAVREAGVEVLIDLRVWAAGGSNETFALRPAPIQANWLAYPGTSGAPWMDYVIADRVVLPPRLAADFSEAVAWLPRCFQPSDPTRVVGEPPPRRACGLPETGVVYVCFNNSYKLNRASFERMLAILRAVPGSVLWLLSGPEGADRRLRDFAHAQSVAPARLVFMRKLPHADYLARYRHADLFLDTVPYNAHTTASDALWAGCPVLTVPGATFASRVAASLNHHLGMDALNAPDDAAFIGMAVRIGRDADACARLHAELAARKRDHGLFDMRGYARDFAALLARMAALHRAGRPPAQLA
ncbi:MAG TPA: tetratricopeptide repeat protein [Rhodanobacteraceae bacterium]|nr:tetratricopeptide repeat protein [Rhodanobacteraceae bacterium]